MIILVPFFGDTKRFRPLLERWIESYRKSGCKMPWFALSDVAPGGEDLWLPLAKVSLEPFRDLIRPGQPFDVKGALLCAAALAFKEPILFLDADAFLVGDPELVLQEFLEAPIAMPLDHGALVWFRTATLDFPFDDVKKTCAGVLFMGPAWARSRVVANYRRSFLQMRTAIPWSPPLKHLLEQYSWSVTHHRICRGRILPHSMNWSSRHLGLAPGVLVDHDYGHSKWDGRPAPANS